ncbi:MAG TPA: uroporphyrinogen decarboxylase family protein [Candidatus Latescibacteria bacterium]|mgnify:CR=1 FL=1|nr:uroporphyrinogen decarboxylase family protein [Candidatus Latescibacterota bacterium]
MSYERGIQAMRLQMPDTIPHTEYVSNPTLVRHVTGIDPSIPGREGEAWKQFMIRLNYDLVWRTDSPPFEKAPHAWMGSARYSETQELKPATYPFANEEEVLSFDPVAATGVPDRQETRQLFERNWRATQSDLPFLVVPSGYYNTVFTWCIVTFGWELFMAAAMADPKRFDRVLEGFYQLSKPIFEAAAEIPLPAFICHDDIVWTAGAVFHPDWYRRFVFPRYKKLWAPLREAGIPILFCSDGNFTEFVPDIADAGANGFIFEPLTDLEMVAARYGKTHVIIGNADCRILTYGSREDIYAEVKRCADIGRSLPGYFFAVGNHIPYNVPVENAMYYFDLIVELGKR